MMQSFLAMANAERIENKIVMTWVRQIRELAYDVEDCIEFVVHLDKKASWWFRLIPSCIAPALPLDEAVHEIEQLKARVIDVSTRNTRYCLISDTGSKPALVQQNQWAVPGTAVPGTAALGMLIGGVGTRQKQGDLTQLITSHMTGVISVLGTSGDLGVTSIIWKAYNDKGIRQKFSCRAWVKLMHPFNPHEFVRCMTDQFYANGREQKEGEIIGVDVLTRTSESTTHGEHYLNEFVQQVNTKRSLVVLDAISKFFLERRNGSCIIVSTQQPEVASLSVGHPFQVWELHSSLKTSRCMPSTKR
ncbi:unnamed protein product [Triticum turgidum subsp. durum]|uniref:Rx N-terminal domain-containing protein n=1 Tax=Triticum turgidum subsp. durum TaxID=4567 RepID=A0A9R1C677_TRITD|nr:unnamed protein product [Triticum turgidum subsp. durum]